MTPEAILEAFERNFGSGVELEVVHRTTTDWTEEVMRTRDVDEARPWRQTLEGLSNWLSGCEACTLCEERTQVVFGAGNPDPDLVVIGEAPGRKEDLKGEPFVGKSGSMLDKMLNNVLELERDQVYILNAVKCRPPDNRDPFPEELLACRAFLDEQLDILKPRFMLSLGRIALLTLFGEQVAGISRERGTWRTYRGIQVMPTFHPAYLLRQDDATVDKRLVWEDLLSLKNRMDLDRIT